MRSRDHVTGTSNGCSVVVCISAVRRENFVSIERELSTTEWHVSFVYGAEIFFPQGVQLGSKIQIYSLLVVL